MADANPAIIGPQIGNGDTAQMSADSWAHQHLGFSGRAEDDFFALVQDGVSGIFVLLLDLLTCQPSYEHRSSVPHNLKHFGRRQLADVHFHVGVAVVSGPPIQSAHEPNGVESGEVEGCSKEHRTEGVDLGAADIGLMFVVDSVLVEPVIDGGFKVDMITEVSRPCRSCEELGFVRN